MKTISKIMSVLLVVCMLLPLVFTNASVVFAAEQSEEQDIINNNDSSLKDEVVDTLTPSNEDLRFFGYGYNVAKGVSVLDSENVFTYNPILNMNNSNLINKIMADMLKIDINNSRSEYIMTSSAYEMAEKKSNYLSAAIGANVKVNMINAGLNASFNTQTEFEKNQIVQEKYETFYKVQKRKIVKTTLTAKELTSYLDNRFVTALSSVNSANAIAFLNKYGTHMPTGYTLGGVLEFTSYYASIDENYQSSALTSLDAAVEAGIADNKAQISASFQDKYVSKIDSSKASLHYRALVYGGVDFPNLTIDQAFTHNFVQGTYVYQAWIDAINRGENLQIIAFPESVDMIPIWDLIPESLENASEIRSTLINAYINMCGEKYSEFCKQYPMAAPSFDSEADNDSFYENYVPHAQFALTGYLTEKNNIVGNYVAFDAETTGTSMKHTVYIGDKIHLGFNHDFENGDGKVQWKIVDGADVATVIDERYGIISVIDEGEFTVKLYYDDKEILTSEIDFNSKRNIYSGGNGTKDNPYIIANVQDYMNLIENPNDWKSNFILMANLDFSGKTVQPIGLSNNKFEGVFDGNNHTISNIKINAPRNNDQSIGIFGHLSGTVKDLTVTKCQVIINQTKTLSDTFEVSVGVLAGTMYDGAVIDKCVISSSAANNILTCTGSGVDKISKLYAGVLAGKIINGTIKNSQIAGNAYTKQDRQTEMSTFDYCYVGGLTGFIANATISDVIICDSTTIYAECLTGTTNWRNDNPEAHMYVGTVAGSIGGGSVNGVYIYNVYNSKDNKEAIDLYYSNGSGKLETDINKGAIFGKSTASDGNLKNIYFKKHANGSDHDFANGKAFDEDKSWYIKDSTFDFETVGRVADVGFKLSNKNPYLSRTLSWKISYDGKGIFEGNSLINLFGTKFDGKNASSYSYTFKETSNGYQVTVKRYNIEKTFTISSLDVKNTRLELVTEPTKIEYIEGMTFDPSGIEIYLRKNNGEKILIKASDLIITDGVIKVGTNVIECCYDDLKYNINVFGNKKDDVDSIVIVNNGVDDKKDYFAGQSFDISKIQIQANYKSGDSVAVSPFDCEIVGASTLVNGKNEIIVSYGDYKQASFELSAQLAKITSISACVKPDVKFFEGGSVTNDKVTVMATYEDGSSRELTPSEFTVENNILNAGENYVKVSSVSGNIQTTLPVSAENIAVTKIDAQVVYAGQFYINDTVKPAQLKVSATYNNGTSKELADNEYEILAHILVEGDNVITISYEGKTCSVTVSAVKPVLVSISAEVNGTPNFFVGGTVNASALKVTATYNNGTSSILESNLFTVKSHVLVEGENEIVIQYLDKTCTVKINARKANIASIFAELGMGVKLYESETLKNENVKVTATYEDGSTKTLSSSEFTISNHILAEGNNTLTVICGKVTCTLAVTAEPLVITSIEAEVKSGYEYKAGGVVSKDSLKVTAIYNNGSRIDVTSNCTIKEHTLVFGENTIEITYEGKSCTVKVNAKAADLIALHAELKQGVVLYENDVLKNEHVKVTAAYSDGSFKELTTSEFTLFGTTLSAGQNNVTVLYSGKTCELKATAIALAIESIQAQIKAGIQFKAGDTVKNEHVTVTATYNNGTSRILSNSEFTISSQSLSEGSNTVTISSESKSCTVTVMIDPINLVSINVSLRPGFEYKSGEVVGKDALKVIAIYSNNSQVELLNEFTVKAHTLAYGDNAIEVTYLDKSCTVTVNAKAADLTAIYAELKQGVVLYENDVLKNEHVKVTATYSDGSFKELTTSEFTLFGTTLSAGQNNVTVLYSGKTCELKATAIALAIESIQAQIKAGIQFKAGDTVKNEHVTVMARFNNGTSRILSNNEFTISSQTLALGTNTVTVIASEKTCVLTVDAAEAEAPTPEEPKPEDPTPDTPIEPSNNPIFAEIQALKDKGITLESRASLKELKQKCTYLSGNDKTLAEEKLQELLDEYAKCIDQANNEFEEEKETANSIVTISFTVKIPSVVLYYDERKRGYVAC